MSWSKAEETVSRAFNAHYVSLVRFGYRQAGSVERAEDAVQAAFLGFYRALTSGEEIQNEKAWLLCVTRREARRMRQRDCRERELPAEMGDWEDVEAPMPEPVDPVFEMDDVLPLLSLLTLREEEVLMMRLSSMKYKDIAAELGVTIPTVNTLLGRAVEKLRRSLKEREGSKRRELRMKEGHATRRVQ